MALSQTQCYQYPRIADAQVSEDPCQTHTVLDNEWRRPESQANLDQCDSSLVAAWYAFKINKEPAIIPTQCIQERSCGTTIPMHVEFDNNIPAVGQTVSASLCGTYNILGSIDCCVLRQPISIKRCSDDVYVYNLTQLDRCPVAICAQKLSDTVRDDLIAKRGDTARSVNSTTTQSTHAELSYPEICPEGLERCVDGRCGNCPSDTATSELPVTQETSQYQEIVRTFAPVIPDASSSASASVPSPTNPQTFSSSDQSFITISSSDSENQTSKSTGIATAPNSPFSENTSAHVPFSSSEASHVMQQNETNAFSTIFSDPGKSLPEVPSSSATTTQASLFEYNMTENVTVATSPSLSTTALDSMSGSSQQSDTGLGRTDGMVSLHSRSSDGLQSGTILMSTTQTMSSTDSSVIQTSSAGLPIGSPDFSTGVRFVIKGQMDEQVFLRYLEISMKVFLASREWHALNTSTDSLGSMEGFTSSLQSLELVYGLFQNLSIINGTLDRNISVYQWVQKLDNNITLFDLIAKDHLVNETVSSGLILAVLKRTNFTSFVNSQHTQMEVVALCLVADHCERDFLYENRDKDIPFFQQHQDIFIVIIVIAAACLVVLLLGFLWIHCSKRGTWVLVQEKEVQNHQMEIESPMTDHQIMDGERQTVTSFTVNGYHSDNPDNDGLEQVDLDQDNTWVVPIDQSITAQEVQDIAGKTEDTHF
ncbi:uncharacterized protein LOC112572951 isoform X3 [Pomacea canaliculata]|uniref:uncharacterized protein LOC112572951 isoform X3 n=1 Tax=Pomacea canaliculata TaxID=400727 RepID=UPI000D726D85|nr:uncharacterized protein LOC112572951 isoform X3 [Pomacea canaliculata]